MQSNVLVTGGAGFIGSALCKTLSAQGFSVTSLDNYHAGSVNNHHNGIEYVKGSTEHIHKHFTKDNSFKYIFHLGEYARVEQSFNDYEKVMQWIGDLKPKKTVFTHMNYDIDYDYIKSIAPRNCMPAYDGLILKV